MNYQDNQLNNKADWIGAPDAPLQGFSWKGGAERHTTGVIMWSDVFLHEELTVGGVSEKYAIILLDTQGLFDSQTSPADNARIFALGTLISSIQIFNLNDVIQEDQLQYLQMATDYAQFNANISSASVKASKPFQHILFLMRDWAHVQDYPLGRAGGDKYVHQHLSTENPGQNPSVKSVREFIHSSFDVISGFLLPHPGPGVTNKDFNGRNDVLLPEFKTHLSMLIQWLLGSHNLVSFKKRILDEEVEGMAYGEFMKQFFEVFQSPDTPKTHSIYEAAIDRQLGNYVTEAMKHYVIGLNNNTDFNRTDFVEYLDKVHAIARNLTDLWFKSTKKMGMKKDEAIFNERLDKEMTEYFVGWKKTSIETWNTMQKERADNQANILKIQTDNKQQMDDTKAKQKQELDKIGEDFKSKIDVIQNQANLSKAEKQKQIDALKIEKANSETKLNQTVTSMMAEHSQKMGGVEADLRAKLENAQKNQKSKTSMIVDIISESRNMFMTMMNDGVKQRAADSLAMQQRWDREDKLKKDELELTRQRGLIMAAERKAELEKAEKSRNDERRLQEKRYQSEMEQRKTAS